MHCHRNFVTVIWGAFFGTVATGLEVTSLATGLVSAGLKFADHNYRGSTAGFISSGVSIFLPKALQRLGPAEGGFAGESGKKFNDYVAGAEGSAAEKLTGHLICR